MAAERTRRRAGRVPKNLFNGKGGGGRRVGSLLFTTLETKCGIRWHGKRVGAVRLGVNEMSMTRALKWPLRVLIALLGIVAVVWVLGMMLPRDHVASRIGTYRVPPERVWAAITDVDAMPSWRIGLKGVTRLPDKNGLPAHIEDTAAGKLKIETQSMEPPRKLVNRIGGENLPFGGT